MDNDNGGRDAAPPRDFGPPGEMIEMPVTADTGPIASRASVDSMGSDMSTIDDILKHMDFPADLGMGGGAAPVSPAHTQSPQPRATPEQMMNDQIFEEARRGSARRASLMLHEMIGLPNAEPSMSAFASVVNAQARSRDGSARAAQEALYVPPAPNPNPSTYSPEHSRGSHPCRTRLWP